ncbi:DUF2268 domain-containing putative Zn-dependent protease [Rossellomorea sp. YZS02]|uniref:DUF2268 domain-containing putative Zn-dependent protease n=1 Tax=Rossellomorea sp. YZS02 TaxID=3097358 RepID=UPI002A1735DE|nr:DUF2268 domain-containing putative Zn-dependent protease [Rossellomorea sp. YZS02]MDX8344621.1 DUF2268 domain-containing putative Zn-dependent protease [Rossellomorea sp. YZS02]
MSEVDTTHRLTQMEQFIHQLHIKPMSDRERLFMDTFQMTKEELDSMRFLGMFDIQADVESLEKQFDRLQRLDYESYIQTELRRLQLAYPSDKPIRLELFMLDEHDEFVKNKLGGVSAFTDWNGKMCFIVQADGGVKTTLKSVIFHEYHHHLRMCKLNMTEGNETLLDRLVLEGLAEHFVRIELGDAYMGPYKSVLSEEEAQKLWNTRFRHHIDDRGEMADSYIFGNKEMGLPFWGGYSLGYHLVEWYMNENSEWTIEELTELPSKSFLLER